MTTKEGFFDTLIYLNLPIGLVAISMLFVSSSLLHVTLPPLIYIAASFVYISLYTINKRTDEREDYVNKPEITALNKIYRNYLPILAIIEFFIGFFLVLFCDFRILILLLLPMVLVILYSVPILPNRFKQRRLKELLVIKNITTALIWAPLVLIPAAYFGLLSTIAPLCFFLIIMVMVFSNSVVFDMRDLEGDKINKISTIPLRLGIRYTKILLLILIIVLGFIINLFAYTGKLPPLAYMLNLNTIYAITYILLFNNSTRKNPNYYLLVDSEFMLMAIFIAMGILLKLP